jgi:hypothetical protein
MPESMSKKIRAEVVKQPHCVRQINEMLRSALTVRALAEWDMLAVSLLFSNHNAQQACSKSSRRTF